jgi:hypothetical protein
LAGFAVAGGVTNFRGPRCTDLESVLQLAALA